MTFGIFLDLLIAALLVITISYAVVLNRKLSLVRRDKTSLERLANSFTQATGRAEESIGKLKQTAESLRERMEKAQALRDDLVFLVERGTGAADRLEDLVRETRGASPGYAGESPARNPLGSAGESSDKAPVAKRQPPVAMVPPARPLTAQGSAGESLARAPLSKSPAPQSQPVQAHPKSARSEAERQLLRAIRAAS